MKRVVMTAVALAATVTVASAADIRPAPPPAVKAPAYVAPLFTWTGFYLGGNIGFGWSDGSGTISPAAGGPPFVPISGDGDGVFGGVQIGYNWQTGPFVIGFETDFQISGGSGTVRGPGGVVIGNTDNEWFGTIRGRLGYAVDRWMFYFTGGGAYTHNKLTAAPPFVFASQSETGWTWTIGGGVEAALWQNWSVKAEYLYLATPDSVPVPAGTRVDGDVDTHLIRLGVNYRF